LAPEVGFEPTAKRLTAAPFGEITISESKFLSSAYQWHGR
jgi:hypothetical protein